jgi:hypothetical protein
MQVFWQSTNSLLNTIARAGQRTQVFELKLDLKPGDLIMTNAEEEFTNLDSHNAFVATQIILASDPNSTTATSDGDITAMNGSNITPDEHHQTFTKNGATVWTGAAGSYWLDYIVLWDGDYNVSGRIESPIAGAYGELDATIFRPDIGDNINIISPGILGRLVPQDGSLVPGQPDALFQHSSGRVSEWVMNGSQITASVTLGNPGRSWHVAGRGDFGGDGNSDILFQTGSGQVWEWGMNGAQVVASSSVGSPGASWHVVGTGDFNGDGKADILLQNGKGQVWQWEMNGSQIIASNFVG